MTGRSGLRRLAVVAAIASILGGAALVPSQAGGGTAKPLRLDVTGWQRNELPLPSAVDGIGPGSYLLIDQPDGTFICSANFVWRDTTGTSYLGAAGHCFLPLDVEAGDAESLAGTTVRVCVAACAFGGQLGASLNGSFVELGPVVYARQHAEGDPGNQIGNDFGVVTVPEEHVDLLRSAMPVFGGPTGAASETAGAVCLYGNATLLAETFLTKGRVGHRDPSLHDPQFDDLDGGGDGWAAAIPSYGGDSGGPVVYCDLGLGITGTEALGILTHGLGLGPVPLGLAAGTSVAEAQAMVLDDTGMALGLVLADGSVLAPAASPTRGRAGTGPRPQRPPR